VNDRENPSRDRAMEHLDEMTCLLYIERQLDRARAQEVSSHAQECGVCRTLLRAMERESRLLTRAMLEEDEALPARLAQFQERARRSMQWIWGVAFGLAATGVYALYTGYIEPWQRQLEVAGFGSTNLLSMLIFQGAFWKGWQSMITLLEIVALLTAGGVALAFFRRRLRRGSALALVLAGFCSVVALASPPAASATEFRKAQTAEVTKNETIKGDMYITGERVRIDGTVDGDVYATGKDIEINGHVTGDVISAERMLWIRGQVDGNVRSLGNTILVAGTVGKSLSWFGDTVGVDPTGKIGGSLTMFGGTLNVDGQLGHDILFFGGHVTISGSLGGGIRVRGDTLSLSSSAKVDGPIHFDGNNPPEVAAGAKLASPVDYQKVEPKPKYREGHYYIWQVIWIAAFVLFGLVLFQAMPKFSTEAVGNVERYGASFGLGVLVFFGVPIAAIIACATVVGLFIGLSAFFLWYAGLYYAQVIVGAMIGQWILGRTNETWPLIGRMAVGVAIVRLCATLPGVGGWVKFGVILWGVGAISLTLYTRFQPAIASGLPSGPLVPPPLPSNTTIGGAQPA
jgi:cytoskeletal protein CcmA (bactofilin family)